jgi:hypothetical protein
MNSLLRHVIGVIPLLLLLLNCSSDDRIAGGTIETTNGITACLKLPDGSAASGAAVTLKSIRITSTGESAISSATMVANDSGKVCFANVPGGKYIILARDSVRGLMGMDAHLLKGPNELIARILNLRAPVTFRGQVKNPDLNASKRIYAFIPGLGNTIPVDSQGFYTFRNVPADTLDIAFALGDTVNYLPVCIHPGSSDTVFIRDAAFATSQGSSVITYCFYRHSVAACYAIVPTIYPAGKEPLWYQGKTFDRVTYFRPSPDGTLIEFTGGNVNILFVVVPQQWNDIGGQISYELSNLKNAVGFTTETRSTQRKMGYR